MRDNPKFDSLRESVERSRQNAQKHLDKWQSIVDSGSWESLIPPGTETEARGMLKHFKDLVERMNGLQDTAGKPGGHHADQDEQ